MVGSGKPTGNPRNARERAQQIKLAQEQALKRLAHGTLYIVLFLRSFPPIANDFHWRYYYHKSGNGGTKYHIKSPGPVWIADHGPTSGVFKSNFLRVLIQISQVRAERENHLDQIMRAYDSSLNGIPGITCRVWLLKVVTDLIQHGLVRCENVSELEQECKAIGNEHRHEASENRQPRPVVVSRVCT
jgi:hypothetical protein